MATKTKATKLETALKAIRAAKGDAAFDFNSSAFDHLWRAEQALTRAIEATKPAAQTNS